MSGIAQSSGVGPGARVNIAGGFACNDTIGGPGTASATITFENDGDVMAVTSVGSTDAGDWITPKAAAPGLYEILVHQNSGSAVTGTLDTWQVLTSNRSWNLTQIGVGSKTANLTASIRLGGVVLSSGTVTLDAVVI